MQSEDPELQKLKSTLRTVEQRKKHLESIFVEGDESTKGMMALLDRKIQTLQQKIRSREYVLSPKKHS
jgi:predicted  nucleic acid-binding Zn-ribbon protein